MSTPTLFKWRHFLLEIYPAERVARIAAIPLSSMGNDDGQELKALKLNDKWREYGFLNLPLL